MSYKLIDANALNGLITDEDYDKVLQMPCIFADLPNGMDGKGYNVKEWSSKVVKQYFDTEEELHDCFSKWEKRLGLSDWFIGLALVDYEEMNDDNIGESNVQWENKCGTIKILKKECVPKDTLLTHYHEVALIHEMLHFKFVAFAEKSREEAYYELMQHQLIEELARAMFLAEYNLQPKELVGDWLVIPNKTDKKGDTE